MMLVTGANGFIGRHLCDQLRVQNMPYLGVSRHRQDRFATINRLDNSTDWSDHLQGVECVVHLAARVHIMKESVSDPLQAFRNVNVDGTLNLARQAAKNGIKRFVYVSSVKVNGESTQTGQPFIEADKPNPSDPYSQSKWEAEQGLMALSEETGLEVVIVRPPLVYGPGVRANFASLLQMVRKGVPLPFALVDNRRSLVSVYTLAKFLILCAKHKAAAGQTFLISDNDDVSTAELIRRISHAYGSKTVLLPVPPVMIRMTAALMRKQAIADRLLNSLQLDVSKSKALLDWSPQHTMAETFAKMAEYDQSAI